MSTEHTTTSYVGSGEIVVLDPQRFLHESNSDFERTDEEDIVLVLARRWPLT